MIVVEWETVSALGLPRTIQITKEAHQLYLEIRSPRGLEALVKLPNNFCERLRVHNLEAGSNTPLGHVL